VQPVGLTARRKKQLHDEIAPLLIDQTKAENLFPQVNVTQSPEDDVPEVPVSLPDDEDIPKRPREVIRTPNIVADIMRSHVEVEIQPPIVTLDDAMASEAWDSQGNYNFHSRPNRTLLVARRVQALDGHSSCDDMESISDEAMSKEEPTTAEVTEDNVLTFKRARKEKRIPGYEY